MQYIDFNASADLVAFQINMNMKRVISKPKPNTQITF